MEENLSLNEQIKNLIDKYYNKIQTKLENENNLKDKKIDSLMNNIANYDKNKIILEEEIIKIKKENNDKNKQLININNYINENNSLKNEMVNM